MKPYGLTYEHWTMKWWYWLLKIPKRNSPAFDQTGNNAYINQNNPNVFFLCQTFENSGSIPVRCIMIQSGMSVFMPLINWISVAPEDGETDKELFLKARTKMNTIKDLKVNVNEHEISNEFDKYRIQSCPFYVELPEENILNLAAGVKRVISDGYWILTEPIRKPIFLKTFGSCSAGLTKIGVKYDVKLI